MCGIAGIVGKAFTDAHMTDMLSVMRHRGPDGEASWSDPEAGIRLGHVRLAIIDLVTGDQPMISDDGRHVIVFNGEIYNYIELRPDLEARGWRFRTTSDTEVLLAGLVLEGPQFLEKTIGMFALALWDCDTRTLLLARDRMGIKPLYVAETPEGFAFASELKALLCLPGVSNDLDPAAVEAFLTLRYVPAPFSLIKGIRKFPPAHYAVLRDGRQTMTRWWNIAFSSGPGTVSADAEDRLDWLLNDAVRLCLRSDVPVGLFLSGGVDSGLVASLVAGAATKPISTFSIGFQSAMDEREEAAAVARAIGSNHTEFQLAPEDLHRLPDMVRVLDEPFPDPIVLAMSLLAERSRRDAKVILTGEGADELFAGYVHHPHLGFLDRISPWLAPGLPTALGAIASRLPPAVVNRFFAYSARLSVRDIRRLGKLAAAAKDPVGRYLAYVSLFDEIERDGLCRADRGSREAGISVMSRCLGESSGAYLDRIWTCEHRYWLADNILLKQDKTLMAFGVEGRVPFCDHRLVEFGAELPMSARLGRKNNKVALRAAAARLAPHLGKRAAKKAFMIPMEGRYGDAIRQLAGDALSSSEFRDLGYFDMAAVDRMLAGFPSPSLLEGKQILALTMLAIWNREVRTAAAAARRS